MTKQKREYVTPEVTRIPLESEKQLLLTVHYAAPGCTPHYYYTRRTPVEQDTESA